MDINIKYAKLAQDLKNNNKKTLIELQTWQNNYRIYDSGLLERYFIMGRDVAQIRTKEIKSSDLYKYNINRFSS